MTDWVRRLRGACGIGVTWSVMWVGVGFVLYTGLRIFRPEDIGPGEGLGTALRILGTVGFLSGLGFSGLLGVAERRKTINGLSLGRAALWGSLGSAAIPLLMGTDGSMGVLTGAMGAVFATTTVALARRGAAQPIEASTRSSAE